MGSRTSDHQRKIKTIKTPENGILGGEVLEGTWEKLPKAKNKESLGLGITLSRREREGYFGGEKKGNKPVLKAPGRTGPVALEKKVPGGKKLGGKYGAEIMSVLHLQKKRRKKREDVEKLRAKKNITQKKKKQGSRETKPKRKGIIEGTKEEQKTEKRNTERRNKEKKIEEKAHEHGGAC